VATALVVLAAADVAAAGTVDHGFAPRVWQDPRDAAGSPLDLREVSFGQRDTHLGLRLRTHERWSAGQLGEDGLCVALAQRATLRRLCVGGDGRGAPVLRLGGRAIRAVVVRRDQRSVFARIHPRALGLGFGRVRWFAESRWETAADRAPQRGRRTATVGALGQPRCFGAAARARARPCVNRALRRAVIPSPRAAVVSPDQLCRRPEGRSPYAVLLPCEFGYRDEVQAPEAALIGDSHSAHWRAAVEVVAQARGWRAVSLTHAGCAFSTEVYPASAAIRARCARHASEALSWLRAHPSVHTVFTSSSAGRGFSPGGFLAIWRQVPPTVKRILVIRDVPRIRFSTASCVLRAMRRRVRTARACAVPRSGAMPADPSAAAARRGPARVRLLDFTRHFCDRARCYPVVGGAYVYKDDNHMNTVFATTLGPFLLRRLAP
jgi:hypothetical protein